MGRHFDEFKAKCAEKVAPYRNRPDMTVEEFLAVNDELARLAIEYGFPHRPQVINVGMGSYPVMIDPDAQQPSFVIG